MEISCSISSGRGSTTTLKASLQRRGKFVDTLVAIIRRRDHVKATPGVTASFNSGIAHLLGQHRNQRILDVRTHARELFQPHSLPPPWCETAASAQSLTRRPMRQQLRVIPAVADLVLVGAGGTLDHHRRITADRSRQML